MKTKKKVAMKNHALKSMAFALFVLITNCPLIMSQQDIFQEGEGPTLLQGATIPIKVADYCTFLNANAITDDDSFYDEAMSLNPATAAILREGVPGNYSYKAIPGKENTPLPYLNWHDKVACFQWLQESTAVPRSDEVIPLAKNHVDLLLKTNLLQTDQIYFSDGKEMREEKKEKSSWHKLLQFGCLFGLFGGGDARRPVDPFIEERTKWEASREQALVLETTEVDLNEAERARDAAEAAQDKWNQEAGQTQKSLEEREKARELAALAGKARQAWEKKRAARQKENEIMEGAIQEADKYAQANLSQAVKRKNQELANRITEWLVCQNDQEKEQHIKKWMKEVAAWTKEQQDELFSPTEKAWKKSDQASLKHQALIIKKVRSQRTAEVIKHYSQFFRFSEESLEQNRNNADNDAKNIHPLSGTVVKGLAKIERIVKKSVNVLVHGVTMLAEGNATVTKHRTDRVYKGLLSQANGTKLESQQVIKKAGAEEIQNSIIEAVWREHVIESEAEAKESRNELVKLSKSHDGKIKNFDKEIEESKKIMEERENELDAIRLAMEEQVKYEETKELPHSSQRDQQDRIHKALEEYERARATYEANSAHKDKAIQQELESERTCFKNKVISFIDWRTWVQHWPDMLLRTKMQLIRERKNGNLSPFQLEYQLLKACVASVKNIELFEIICEAQWFEEEAHLVTNEVERLLLTYEGCLSKLLEVQEQLTQLSETPVLKQKMLVDSDFEEAWKEAQDVISQKIDKFVNNQATKIEQLALEAKNEADQNKSEETWRNASKRANDARRLWECTKSAYTPTTGFIQDPQSALGKEIQKATQKAKEWKDKEAFYGDMENEVIEEPQQQQSKFSPRSMITWVAGIGICGYLLPKYYEATKERYHQLKQFWPVDKKESNIQNAPEFSLQNNFSLETDSHSAVIPLNKKGGEFISQGYLLPPFGSAEDLIPNNANLVNDDDLSCTNESVTFLKDRFEDQCLATEEGKEMMAFPPQLEDQGNALKQEWNQCSAVASEHAQRAQQAAREANAAIDEGTDWVAWSDFIDQAGFTKEAYAACTSSIESQLKRASEELRQQWEGNQQTMMRSQHAWERISSDASHIVNEDIVAIKEVLADAIYGPSYEKNKKLRNLKRRELLLKK